MTGAIDDEMRARSMRRAGFAVMLAALIAAVGLRQEDAAGRAADAAAAAAARRPRRRRRGRRRRPSRSREPIVVPPEPVRDDAISSASLDDLNKNSPLKPVFFELDSSELERRRARRRSTRTRRC